MGIVDALFGIDLRAGAAALLGALGGPAVALAWPTLVERAGGDGFEPGDDPGGWPSLGPRVYVASRARHARRWRDLRDEGLNLCSTWVDEATDDPSDLWERCVREAASADALILYREPGDALGGALVEVGAALAHGVPVYAVGFDGDDVPSFVNHPNVFRVPSLDIALGFARAVRPRLGNLLRGVDLRA